MSEELGFASLHLCSVVRALEANMKNPTSSEEKQRLAHDYSSLNHNKILIKICSNSSEAGIRLFYLLADMYSGERANCIPTKKLIANSVEMIGQVNIIFLNCLFELVNQLCFNILNLIKYASF